MTREDIIRMAREANLPSCHITHPKALERFAALVAAHEREECAKLSEEVDGRLTRNRAPDCAVAIRARGEK
jgi:hypothetical protein